MTQPEQTSPTPESTLGLLLTLWGGIRPHEAKKQKALVILRAAEQAARRAALEEVLNHFKDAPCNRQVLMDWLRARAEEER